MMKEALFVRFSGADFSFFIGPSVQSRSPIFSPNTVFSLRFVVLVAASKVEFVLNEARRFLWSPRSCGCRDSTGAALEAQSESLFSQHSLIFCSQSPSGVRRVRDTTELPSNWLSLQEKCFGRDGHLIEYRDRSSSTTRRPFIPTKGLRGITQRRRKRRSGSLSAHITRLAGE